MQTTLLNRQRGRRIELADLRRFLDRLVHATPAQRGDSLAICLVSERRMREMNREYRGVDSATDVLSFVDAEVDDPSGEVHLGDIVVSVPNAARQARAAGHSLDRELRVLIIHGYLHLLGFDHETDDGTMLRKQRVLVRRLLRRSPGNGAPQEAGRA